MSTYQSQDGLSALVVEESSASTDPTHDLISVDSVSPELVGSHWSLSAQRKERDIAGGATLAGEKFRDDQAQASVSGRRHSRAAFFQLGIPAASMSLVGPHGLRVPTQHRAAIQCWLIHRFILLLMTVLPTCATIKGCCCAFADALGENSAAGTSVAVPSPRDVADRGDEEDADEDDAGPVHRVCLGRVDGGEAEEDAKHEHVNHGDGIDRPANSRRKSVRTAAFNVAVVEHECADDHGVACKEEDGECREERVEGGDAAEVDDADAARDKGAQDERLDGHMQRTRHPREERRRHQTTVSCKRPGDSTGNSDRGHRTVEREDDHEERKHHSGAVGSCGVLDDLDIRHARGTSEDAVNVDDRKHEAERDKETGDGADEHRVDHGLGHVLLGLDRLLGEMTGRVDEDKSARGGHLANAPSETVGLPSCRVDDVDKDELGRLVGGRAGGDGDAEHKAAEEEGDQTDLVEGRHDLDGKDIDEQTDDEDDLQKQPGVPLLDDKVRVVKHCEGEHLLRDERSPCGGGDDPGERVEPCGCPCDKLAARLGGGLVGPVEDAAGGWVGRGELCEREGDAEDAECTEEGAPEETGWTAHTEHGGHGDDLASPVAGAEQTDAEKRQETELSDERLALAIVVVLAVADDVSGVVVSLLRLFIRGVRHGGVGRGSRRAERCPFRGVERWGPGVAGKLAWALGRRGRLRAGEGIHAGWVVRRGERRGW
ncbi:hypothetical protein L1887_48217 [Cichorium endivia]|nr:hypothetical protein L1887_48217 [Cichorium endivia]